MKLNDIRDNAGARKKPMTVGRGIGCTKGKTCGRGVKGQKARTGVSIGGFEGGQMPMSRRMPKRGFNSLFANQFSELTLVRLQTAIDDGRIDAKATITDAILMESGVAPKARDGVRLLANGELKAKVTLEIAGASKGAVAAVEKAGGKITFPPKKEPTTGKMQKKA